MLITKTSILTDITRTKEIPITPEQYQAWLSSKEPIQNVFPHVSPDDREFLLTGSTPEEWDKVFEEN